MSAEAVAEAAKALRSGEPCLILVTGRALREQGLDLAGKIAGKTFPRLILGLNAGIQRGRLRVFLGASRTSSIMDEAVGGG